MTSNERQRRLARAKYERQQQRRQSAQQRRRLRQRIVAIAVVLVVLAGAVAWILVGRSGQETAIAPSPSAIAPSPSAIAPSAPSAAPSGAAGSPAAPAADCGPLPTPRTAALSWPSAPPLDGTEDSDITLQTNCGPIVIRTLAKEAPATVASERFLVQQGFYDGTTCHRLVTAGIYVLQCGDPEGTGTGGPGYSVPDENLPADGAANYPAGTVAMANAGPGTAGSQFFIVYEDTSLPGAYTVWGTVVAGLDVVKAVAAQGVLGGGSDGPPAQPIGIETATVGPAAS